MFCEEPNMQASDPRVSLSQCSQGETVVNVGVNPPLWVIVGQIDPNDSTKQYGTEIVSGYVSSYDRTQAAFIRAALYGTTVPPTSAAKKN